MHDNRKPGHPHCEKLALGNPEDVAQPMASLKIFHGPSSLASTSEEPSPTSTGRKLQPKHPLVRVWYCDDAFPFERDLFIMSLAV